MPKKSSIPLTIKQTPYNFDVVWEELMENEEFVQVFLSDVLEDYIVKQRWYGGKSSKLKYIELSEYFRIQQHEEVYYGLILEVNFAEAFYQHYFLPIAFVSDESFATDDRILPLSIQNQEGFIIDAINLEAFRKVVFERILTAVPNDTTRVQYHKSLLFCDCEYETSRFMGMEQSNTSIIYNEKYVLKFFRRIYADRNPDYEMSRFLSEKKEFKNIPAYLGSIQIKDHENVNITIALMQEMVQNKVMRGNICLKSCIRYFQILNTRTLRLQNYQEQRISSVSKLGTFRHKLLIGLD